MREFDTGLRVNFGFIPPKPSSLEPTTNNFTWSKLAWIGFDYSFITVWLLEKDFTYFTVIMFPGFPFSLYRFNVACGFCVSILTS